MAAVIGLVLMPGVCANEGYNAKDKPIIGRIGLNGADIGGGAHPNPRHAWTALPLS